jgi:hypothetical protein
MMEAIRSSETTDLKRARWRNIPEDGILQINCLFVRNREQWKLVVKEAKAHPGL